jgi:heme A synthase
VIYGRWGFRNTVKGEKLMIWWIFVLVIVTVLSYLSDVGILTFMQDWRIPFLNASILSILMLLCLLGLLGRMMQKSKRGEKETLREKINQLESEIAGLKEKQG